jgi:hypothetical protein
MPHKKSTKGYQPSLLQTADQIQVSMHVDRNHPLLQLKRALDWPAIRDTMTQHLRNAGCNVDYGPGRPLDLDLYVPLIVLMLIKGVHARQMEELLTENAVARVFIDWEHHTHMQVRDHSNIARILEALGSQGIQALNALILNQAVTFGFADPKTLSGDTTAQELPIGYPNEAGILKGLAERCVRSFEKLRKKGKRNIKKTKARFSALIQKAKEYHLFAKGKEKKKALLQRMVKETRVALKAVEKVTKRFERDCDRTVHSAIVQLKRMGAVGAKLLPQIEYWLRTGFVAKGKIIHAGITDARAIVRNKVGKKVEFGLHYLLCMVGGGYLMGELLTKPIGESKMPLKSLKLHRQYFGEEAELEFFSYDRGGWSTKNGQELKKEGVQKVGIQPKGRARWLVHGTDRKQVLRERANMEGRIGNLKTTKYGFNKPKARKFTTLQMAGQRSILSFNLNKMMRDIRTAAMKEQLAL